jgi:sn-glycerol 3-phosphate transport system ATP-binding protein
MGKVLLKDVKKSFGKVEVIHGVDCEIGNGEFVVILGPSGCGKSTILRMIAGLEEVTVGEIYIGEKLVNQLEPAKRDIAMVFQNYALYPHMSVYKNMAYSLKIRRVAKEEIKKRVLKAAKILELTEFLDRKPRQLSGGQRQRVAMGRCIVREPEVFLFDEPLSNLDAKLRVQMRLEIRRLYEKLKVTSIYVTHDQTEAMTLGDRLLVMENGHVAQIGTPLEVYEQPANRFVAGFIGSPSMNFMEVQLSADSRWAILSTGVRLSLSGDALGGYGGGEVLLGIRPEHFCIGNGRVAPKIPLEVSYVESLGADTLLYGHFPKDEVLITVRLPGIHQFRRGTIINLEVSPEKLHVFDRETGTRID